MLPKAEVLGFGDDYVVAQGDSQQLACSRKLLRKGDIFLAGFYIARGMVMRDDYAGRAVGDRIGKHFARMRGHGVQNTDCNRTLCNQPLATVKT